MLDTLRRSAGSWVIKILFAVLVVSFAVWGIGDIFRQPGRDAAIATVGDQSITGAELLADFNRQVEQMRSVLGDSLTAEKARNLGILDAVLDRMIRRALFDNAAQDLGLGVSDKMVRKSIRKDPTFQGESGKFDRFRFAETLRNVGYTEEAYVTALRREIGRNQIISTIKAGTGVPEGMADALYRFRNEARVADAVTVESSSITDVGKPDEAALVAFHKENADRFTAPEYRAITAVTLEAKDLAKEIAVPEKEVRQSYDDNPARFTTPERRKVRQMVLPDEKTAQRASKMLSEGADFATVAKELAGQSENDISLGWVLESELPTAMRKAVFGLDKAGISAPVKSGVGWHIMEVMGIKPKVVLGFETVRAKLRTEIAENMALDSVYSLATKLEDTLAGGASLEEAANQLNLKLVTVTAIDRRGRNPAGKKVSDMPSGDFLNTAFATKQGEDSTLIETPDGGYYILRVDKVTDRALKPLDSIRDQVVAAWKAQQRSKAAMAEAKKIVEKVKAGRPLAEVAREMGLKVTTTKPLRRSASSLPPALVHKMFEARLGGVAMAPTKTGVAVAELKKIIPADPAKDKAGVAALRREMRKRMANDLLSEYTASLYERLTVKVKTSAIQSLF